ncbi:MAG TPA: Na+/H+ antiporter NhaC family protein [Woeseiaceae bacterium]|nr:Na+/H+ antiporter NhaC family protein [Woeseiaceae bacterium]
MSWLSVLPPIVAIVAVLWRKEVILALLLAIFTAELLQVTPGWGAPFAAFLDTIEQIVGVFGDADNARLLIFSLLIGALLAYLRESGGVAAMVAKLVNRGIATNARRASLLTSAVGTVIFIESNLSVLTAGILSRGLFDKFHLSRAKLAYIIDSTSAPVCILILLNGWGAFILALLSNYEFEQTSASILWGTIHLNFYAIVTLIIVYYTSFSGKYFGPLATSKPEVAQIGGSSADIAATKARYMIVPLAVMIFGMLGFMYWTGDGVLSAGSGSKSVLYATVLAALVAYLLMLFGERFEHIKLVKIGFEGMGELLPLVAIVLLALALGGSLRDLGTGIFIAGLVGENLPQFLIPAMLFLAGGLISFSTGTSWGTFAILIPLGMPLAQALDLPPALLLSAILGGGVFGDHCSPISDTTAVSAIASGCDLLEHVRTQLPYALFAGGITLLLYVITGLVLL